MKPPTRQSERHVEAVLAALDVLECFLSKPTLSIMEIMQRTGFTRNRVMRLTGTLLNRHFLMSEGETGAFAVGAKVFALGKVFEGDRGVLLLTRPVLREITLESGESASFYMREGLERVVIAREEGTHAIRHAIAEGQRMDLHAGAAGKLILAFSPPEVVQAVVAKAGLPKRTSATITEKGALMAELATIRAQGHAVSVGERAADACSIAVPIRDYSGALLGALAISGPISRFTPQARQSYLKLLRAGGAKLSRQLGWQESMDNQDGRLTNAEPEERSSHACR